MPSQNEQVLESRHCTSGGPPRPPSSWPCSTIGSTPSSKCRKRLRRKRHCARVKHLVAQCNGLFGKVVADLIAEGQGDPSILKELYESPIRPRRTSTVADIERGITSGEFLGGTDPELLLDAIVAPMYLRLLLRHPTLTEEYGNQLIDQALLGIRTPKWRAGQRSKRVVRSA